MARDTWLYGNADEETKAFIAKSKGWNELNTPASDVNFRMLTGAYKDSGPRITNLGGSDKTGYAVSVRKSAPDYPATRQLKDPFEGLYSQGIALEPPLPPDRLLNLTEESTLHSGCLMAKAFDACGRGWGFEARDGKKANKALMRSPMPEKLKMGMEQVTPDLTFGEMLYQAAWEMDAIGWSVWEVVRLEQGGALMGGNMYAPIGAIYPIPSFTMRATIDPRRWVQIRAGRVRFFKKFGAKCAIHADSGKIFDWRSQADMAALADVNPEELASELIIFKAYTPRSLWYGIPRWISAIPTIAELTAIREFNVSWFASGGQTDYMVHFKSENEEVAKAMRDSAQQQMQENQGRGHTNILTAGDSTSEVTAQKLGELLREGHFRFRRGDLAKEVLIAHTVPPYRIGWAETGGGSGLSGNPASEMLSAYKFGAIEPIQTIIEDRLYCTLFDKEMGIDTGLFRFKLAELQLDDVEKELDAIIKKVENAIMTPNQAREELGLDPVEDDEATDNGAVDTDRPEMAGPVAGANADKNPFEQAPANASPQEQQEPASPASQNPFEQGKDKKNPFVKKDGVIADPNAQEQEIDPAAQTDPAAPKPEDGAPKPPFGGKPGMPEKPKSQAEAMNKYYFKGKELGAPEPSPMGAGGPPEIGPDGKPLPPKPFGGGNPFAPKAGPDGSPAPAPDEKTVDKSFDMIKEFGAALRDALREQPSVPGTDASSSERRPSPSRPERKSKN